MMDDAMGAKRQMLVKRKAPLVVAVEEKLAADPETEEPESIVCPKCGAQLAATPENQAYVDGMDLTEDEDEDE